MIKTTKRKMKSAYYLSAAAITMGALSLTNSAHAQLGDGGVTNFSTVSTNITESIRDVPGLVSSVSYLVGLLLAVLGIMKIKDHVENPTQTPLKDGMIRLAAGGGLFGIPIITQAMLGTIEGEDSVGPAGPGQVNRIVIQDTFAN
ncbi:hypothetical protein N9Z27_00770 [Alphaproteobacteria bacterium]|nr:hypothetical protein [Alphaproteobacteria bacterium]